MRRLLARSLLAVLSTSTVLAATSRTPVLAHETRAVGRFEFAVGWGDEPAHSASRNSIQLVLSEANGGPPVTDALTLAVELIRGNQRTTLALVPYLAVSGGRPGEYRAWVTPTRAGSYTFRFTGLIRGQGIDESFTENDVEEATNIAFPVKDPSTAQLATRVDREASRLDDAARSARQVAAVAAIVATVAVVIAALALRRSSRDRKGTLLADEDTLVSSFDED